MRLVKSRMRDTPLSWKIQSNIFNDEMDGKHIPFIESLGRGGEFYVYLKRWGDWYGVDRLKDRLKAYPIRKNQSITFKGKFYGHH